MKPGAEYTRASSTKLSAVKKARRLIFATY